MTLFSVVLIGLGFLGGLAAFAVDTFSWVRVFDLGMASLARLFAVSLIPDCFGLGEVGAFCASGVVV